MKSKMFFISIAFQIILINNSFSQGIIKDLPNIKLYNTQVKEFYSEIVNDYFRIYLSLPDNYSQTSEKYPVLYVLDGDVSFGMAASIARYLQLGNNIPELIIVGIGYGELTEENGNKRKRDYTPAESNISGDGGGAELFLSFLKDELIAYIDSKYRTNVNSRTINSYSLGGLFALFTLFESPETFNNYIIGSPYVSWGGFAINEYEERAMIKYKELKANVFISVGSEESDKKYFDPIDEIVTKIQNRNYTGLKLVTKVFDGGTHLLCPPEALSYGLISVF